MRCSNCQSIMCATEIVNEGQTEQTRFECSICGRTHLSSRRLTAFENGGNRYPKPVARRPKAACLTD